MARPRKYDDKRVNTSIRLSENQKKVIYNNFDSVQAFIEEAYVKLETRINRRKIKRK